MMETFNQNRFRGDERRPLTANADDRAAEVQHVSGHCHDAEKCNAETFCDCICRRCMGTKRGEYSTR